MEGGLESRGSGPGANHLILNAVLKAHCLAGDQLMVDGHLLKRSEQEQKAVENC